MAPPTNIYTQCMGTAKRVWEFAVSLEQQGNDDRLVQLTLKDKRFCADQLERYVRHGIRPDASEVEKVYDQSVKGFMDHVGDDVGNCGHRLDGKQHWLLLNFSVEATRRRREGQTRGDRIGMDNETMVLTRNLAAFSTFLDGGTPEDALTPAIAAQVFDERVDIYDYFNFSCIGTKACPAGNDYDEFKKQLLKDAESRGLPGKNQDEKLLIHDLRAANALAYRLLHWLAVGGNGPLKVLIASTRNNDRLFDNKSRSKIETPFVTIFITPHPTNYPFQMKHVGNFPPAEVDRITAHWLEFFQSAFVGAYLPDGETPVSVPSSVDEFNFFRKRAGHLDSSPEELAALAHTLHAARVLGGTNCYLMQRGVHDPEHIRAMTRPATLLMQSEIRSLAVSDFDMILPGGYTLSEICDPTDVELRQFYIAEALSPLDVACLNSDLFEYRHLTEEEKKSIEESIKSNGGDIDAAIKEAAARKMDRFGGYLETVRVQAEREVMKATGAPVQRLAANNGMLPLTLLMERTLRLLAIDPAYRLPGTDTTDIVIRTERKTNGKGRALCKVEGCPKPKQQNKDGFCCMHFNMCSDKAAAKPKLSADDVEQRMLEIAKALKPKDLVDVNPKLFGPHYFLSDEEEKSERNGFVSVAEQDEAVAKALRAKQTAFGGKLRKTICDRAKRAKDKANQTVTDTVRQKSKKTLKYINAELPLPAQHVAPARRRTKRSLEDATDSTATVTPQPESNLSPPVCTIKPPPKKAFLARAKGDEVAGRLPFEPSPSTKQPVIQFQAGRYKVGVKDPELLRMLDDQYRFYDSLEEEERRRIAEGMRVKVKFVQGWFKGTVRSVLLGGRKISIDYDDGTAEEADFPDADIVVL